MFFCSVSSQFKLPARVVCERVKTSSRSRWNRGTEEDKTEAKGSSTGVQGTFCAGSSVIEDP